MTDSAEQILGRPMRWAQLTFTDDDPSKIDVDWWLDYFRRTHSAAACLSAGGCVAYYPTDVPLHYRSRWLGERDLFGEFVTGCREMDMVVAARTDPHAFHDDVAEAHPDWVAVDAEGNPRRHWAHPDYWVACTLGPYSFEMMTDVTREIVQRYDVDAIFCNRWAGSGRCFCEHCRANFRHVTGFEIPTTEDPTDAARQAYLAWWEQRLFELWRMWDAEVKKIKPAAAFVPNIGGGAMSPLDMATAGELAPALAADRQARRGLAAPWANGKSAKEYRATLDGKAVIGIFSVGIEEAYRWKDSVQVAPEIRIWAADGIAQGLRPWFTKFSGEIRDPRWLDVVEAVYTWHHANEKYLRNTENLARVGLVYSQQTARHYGGPDAAETVEQPIRGVYEALIEARIPFEMVHDRLLDAEHLAGYKLLILPNIAALSDRQCEQIRQFVGRGGSVLATWETSLRDELGGPRPDLGLADLFGVHFTGTSEGPMRNAYLTLHHPHPILDGLAAAPRIIHGTRRIKVQPTSELADRPVTLVPPYPDLPMEEVYPREEQTDQAELILRAMPSGGRVAYFPWDIGRTLWEVSSPDHARLLTNTVRWALNEPPVVSVEGQGLLDVAVWRQEGSVTVHLVNLTNPRAMKGPCRELIPSPPQTVRLRLPAGTQPRDVHLLSGSEKPTWREREGVIEVHVPPFAAHEVVAVDL